jgi:hypothetical protein
MLIIHLKMILICIQWHNFQLVLIIVHGDIVLFILNTIISMAIFGLYICNYKNYCFKTSYFAMLIGCVNLLFYNYCCRICYLQELSNYYLVGSFICLSKVTVTGHAFLIYILIFHCKIIVLGNLFAILTCHLRIFNMSQRVYESLSFFLRKDCIMNVNGQLYLFSSQVIFFVNLCFTLAINTLS